MIQIRLDGKPVTKLEAARAAANLGRAYEPPHIRVGEPDEDGHVSRRYVTVRARYHAYGDMQPAEVSWPSIGSVSAAEARAFAESIALGAEIAELAEMLAAEQDAAGPELARPWAARDDRTWAAGLPDGRTAVITQLMEGDEDGNGASFVPRVHESSIDFVAGPSFGSLPEAAQWCTQEGASSRVLTDDEATDAKPEPRLLAGKQLQDLLSLVGVKIPLPATRDWTAEQFAQAQNWAAAEHLSASDNDVARLPKPAFLANCEAEADLCRKPEKHGASWPIRYCATPSHHAEPASLVGQIVEDAHDDSPCPVTGLVIGQVDEDTVEVLWGERQHAENPGTGTYEPVDALRPAREQAGA